MGKAMAIGHANIACGQDLIFLSSYSDMNLMNSVPHICNFVVL